MLSTSRARWVLFLLGLTGQALAWALWWLQGRGSEAVGWHASAAAAAPALVSPDGRRHAQVLSYEVTAPRSSSSATSAGRMLALTFTDLQRRRSETWVVSDQETGTPSLIWLDGQRLALQGAGKPRVIFTFARGAAP